MFFPMCVYVCVCVQAQESPAVGLPDPKTLLDSDPHQSRRASTAEHCMHAATPSVSGPSPFVCSAPQTTVWQGKAESWSIVWCEHTVFFCSTSLHINTFCGIWPGYHHMHARIDPLTFFQDSSTVLAMLAQVNVMPC